MDAHPVGLAAGGAFTLSNRVTPELATAAVTDDRARSPSIELLVVGVSSALWLARFVVGAFLGPVRLAFALGLVAVGASVCYRFRAGRSRAEAEDRRG